MPFTLLVNPKRRFQRADQRKQHEYRHHLRSLENAPNLFIIIIIIYQTTIFGSVERQSTPI